MTLDSPSREARKAMQMDIKTTNSKEFVRNVKLLKRTLVRTHRLRAKTPFY
jgi:hypothetical protein